MKFLGSGTQSVGFLIILGLVVVGGGLVTIGWVDYVRTNEVVTNAEQTEVTILESSVSEPDGSSSDNDEYRITIRYEYEIDGQRYKSSSVNPGISDRSYSQRWRAQAIVDKYPVGETRTGYVHSAEPNRAYLEQPSRADQLENNALNIGMSVVGGLMFLLSSIGAVRMAAGIDR